MTSIAIALVLLSAFLHALWNFIAKKARGGPAFVWLFSTIEIIIFLPFVIYFIIVDDAFITFQGLIFIMGSACLHLTYFLLLSKGYQVGDLSLVYPLARATGPLISTFAAIPLLDENPTPLAIIGGLMICGGVFWLTGDPRRLRGSDAMPGIIMAVLTGLSIAAYTLWDAYAVSRLLVIPFIYQWGLGVFRMLMLTPYTLRHWDGVIIAWKFDKWKAVFVSVFGVLSYLLILAVLATNPVSYVAPMRVISTLLGVIMGTRFLNEGDVTRRLTAAAAMVIGVFALSLG